MNNINRLTKASGKGINLTRNLSNYSFKNDIQSSKATSTKNYVSSKNRSSRKKHDKIFVNQESGSQSLLDNDRSHDESRFTENSMCQEENKLYHKMDKHFDSRIYEKSKQYDMLCKLAEQNDFNIEEESKRFINSLSEYEIDCLYNKGEYYQIINKSF